MYKFLILVFLILGTSSFASEIKVDVAKTEQIKFNDKYPLKLIYADNRNILYTMGDKNFNTKTLVAANQQLRNIKTTKLKTNKNERADHFIWTDENTIILWENKKGKDRDLYFQNILKNGRITSRTKIDVLKDGFSPYLRAHDVQTIESPGRVYFAFIINQIVSKNYYGKNAVFQELIAVFDKDGKLIDKQKNTYSKFEETEHFYFLTDSSDILKISSQQKNDKILVERKNLLNKEKEVFSVELNKPDSVFIKYFRIDYNAKTNTYDYFARIKSADSIIGQNGVFNAKFDLENRSQLTQATYILDSVFLEGFKNNPSHSNGNITFKDNSLHDNYVIRKVLPKDDGGFYIIQEYFSQESFTIKNDHDLREKPDEVKSFFNIDYKPNIPYNTYEFILSNINKDGSIAWVKRVPKYQRGLSYQFGTFDAFTEHNDLYLLYNKEERKKSFTKGLDSNYIAVSHFVPLAKKVNNDGEVEFFKLDKFLKDDVVLFPLFSTKFLSNGKLIGYGVESTNSTPSKGQLLRIGIQD